MTRGELVGRIGKVGNSKHERFDVPTPEELTQNP
jgi:hypothetical protein